MTKEKEISEAELNACAAIFSNALNEQLVNMMNSLPCASSGVKATIHINILVNLCALTFADAALANSIDEQVLVNHVEDFKNAILKTIKTSVKRKSAGH